MSTVPELTAVSLDLALDGCVVVHDFNAAFTRGWTAIVGPNGAGKSTLLRGLAGLLKPTTGQIQLHGQSLTQMVIRRRAQEIAWLPQQMDIFGELTVRETVALGRLPHRGWWGAASNEDDAIIEQAMQQTACAHWQHRLLRELSGGERQRVLLARVLATQAPIVLLDEPTTHLDPPHQVALVRLLRKLAATHTVVSVLHDLTLALQADYLLVMRGGTGVAAGRSDDPVVIAALIAAFDSAIRIDTRHGQRLAIPNL